MYSTIAIVALGATAAALAVHYLAFGPKHRGLGKGTRDVHRFGLLERLFQAGTLATFLVLAVSGLVPAIALGASIPGWWGVAHVAVAPAFAACVALLTLARAEDSRFEAHDWEWAKGLGGYLGSKRACPAGRFHAEQKAIVWASAALTIALILTGLGRMNPIFGAKGQHALLEIHRYSALLLTLLVMAHLYLGSLATPGALAAAISGKVSADWAKCHHSVWWEGIQEQRGDGPDPQAAAEAPPSP